VDRLWRSRPELAARRFWIVPALLGVGIASSAASWTLTSLGHERPVALWMGWAGAGLISLALAMTGLLMVIAPSSLARRRARRFAPIPLATYGVMFVVAGLTSWSLAHTGIGLALLLLALPMRRMVR
jgi:hypothetical protein